MNRSIKFILFVALFALGITNAGNTWIRNSLSELTNPDAGISECSKASENAFFITNSPETSCSNFSYYGESEETSAFDISNAILLQSNVLNGLNTPKILKNSSTIRSMRTIDADLLQENVALNNIENFTLNPSYRYYVYTLRHIII